MAGSGLEGSGWAARRFLRSAHQVSKWSTQAWMVIGPRSQLIDDEAGRPHVVDQRDHGGGTPGGLAAVLVEQARGDVVVAVGEDGGGDLDPIAENAACRVTAAIDLGLDLFDDDSLTAFGRFHSIPIVSSLRVLQLDRSLHLTEE